VETIALEKLFRQQFHETPDRINPLKGDASERRIYRMQNAHRSAIGIAGDHRAENEAFIYFSQHFAEYHLPVPHIYAVDLNSNVYLVQDLGLFTLYEHMAPIRDKQGFTEDIVFLYEKALSWLPRFQIEAGKTLNYSYCYQHAVFGRESMSWDLQYFQHRFLSLFYRNPIDRDKLQREFQTLVDHLLEEPALFFLYRDFQSRNIMVMENETYFIDYQSGRRGALQYDVASLLYDAKADLPEYLRNHLMDCYLQAARSLLPIDRDRFMHYFYSFVLIRVLQAFGAYGYLAGVRGKKSFLKSVPYALKNVTVLLEKAWILQRLPLLQSILTQLVQDASLYRL